MTGRMERHTTPKTAKRRAWQAMSKYIRARDPYCVTCPNPTTDAGHFQYNTERNQQLGGNLLWFDERNINGQCAKCNRFAAGMLVPYNLYLQKKYGPTVTQELYDLWRTPKKWTLEEILEREQHFKDKLAALYA
ncbi:MAG TPA: recombination protein NinG [Stellaceae bacterium]|jgi:hypothetical protein|nr:recombination protein NinG [Stellaceae bacterium]